MPVLCILVVLGVTPHAHARSWSDTHGQFKIEAEAIGYNETTVVLKTASGRLLAVELSELSAEDQAFVKSKQADSTTKPSADEMQTWTSKDGLKFRGRVLAYGKKLLAVQRQLGKVFINDQPFSRIDQLHQKLILKILSHLENENLEDERQLQAWAKGLGADVKTYPLEGVLMELESGDIIGVPFFLFAQEELSILKPGWEYWLAHSDDDEARNREDLMIQSTANEYQRDRQNRQQIEMLKLGMLARATGLITIWEVMLRRPGDGGRTMSVMVQADNSDIASQMVQQQYPGFKIVGVRRSRKL
tara:strand:+ start:68367 stop:69275 length:909 start_codon:yes stop_codon:yes gene_type:complete